MGRTWILLLGLAACATGPAPISTLMRQLESPKPEVKIRAAEQLAARGPEAAPALPKLLNVFRDNRKPVYQSAAKAIRSVGPEGAGAFANALSDRDAWVRCRAAENLGLMGPAAKSAVPQLIEALADHDFCVSDHAATALAKIGEPAFWPVLDALKADETPARRAAADALSRMDPALQVRAADEIKPHLKSKDEFERGEAAARLTAMGKAALPVFLETLWDRDVDLRHRSLDAIAEIGEVSPAVIDAVAGLFRDSDRTLRLQAAVVLGKFGQKDPSVLPRLLPLLQSKDTEVRRGAVSAIGEMGAAGAPALDQLVVILQNPKDPLQDEAAEALNKMGTTDALRAAEIYTHRTYHPPKD